MIATSAGGFVTIDTRIILLPLRRQAPSPDHPKMVACTRAEGTWSDRYGERHRQERITDFPRGVRPPQKVRLYWRRDHYILQWWDPGEKRTLSDRIDGGLLEALTRVRQVDESLVERGRTTVGRRRLSVSELVAAYQNHLRQRADAGEVDVRTIARYSTALKYLLAFATQPAVRMSWGTAKGGPPEF